jgi:hypothetical protein
LLIAGYKNGERMGGARFLSVSLRGPTEVSLACQRPQTRPSPG